MAKYKKCKPGYYRHNKTKRCRKVANKKPCGTGKYRSRKTGRCRKIERKVNRKSPSSVISSVIAPFAFTDTNPCPAGKVRNPKSGMCIKETGELAQKLGLVKKRCPTGKVYYKPTNRCRKIKTAKVGKRKAAKKGAKKTAKAAPVVPMSIPSISSAGTIFRLPDVASNANSFRSTISKLPTTVMNTSDLLKKSSGVQQIAALSGIGPKKGAKKPAKKGAKAVSTGSKEKKAAAKRASPNPKGTFARVPARRSGSFNTAKSSSPFGDVVGSDGSVNWF